MALQDYHNILVPVDGSESALRAVNHAVALAQAADLQILLLYVAPIGPIEMMKAVGYPVTAQHEAEKEATGYETLRKELADHVFAQARALVPENLKVQQMMRPGDPAQVILDQAEKLGNALIVMGSRGMSDVRELVLGGVSTKVLHHAHCPVTIVH